MTDNILSESVSAANPIARRNRRVLIVDDNPSIHDDFRKILTPHASAPDFAAPTERAGASATPPGDLADLEARIFGQTPAA
ncbi:MAG: hypothetical protein NZ561_01495, partial [Phycisphaerae bacterium]|nr:hypothetical protein [Phycisphaerae bacterium]